MLPSRLSEGLSSRIAFTFAFTECEQTIAIDGAEAAAVS